MTLTKDKPMITQKQANFCDLYIETGNASEAYRRSYSCDNSKDSTITRQAHELLKNPNITARLKTIQDDLKTHSDIKKNEILEELSAIAFSDIRDYLVFNGKRITFKPFDKLTNRQSKAIESIKKGRNGIELRLHGKSWTIDRICKMLGFDSPTQININELSEEQIDGIVLKLKNQTEL